MEKCSQCPLKGTNLICQAEKTGHTRFCELVAQGNTAYIDYLRKTPASFSSDPTPAPQPVVSKPKVAITFPQIRAALLDEKFRDILPDDMKDDVEKFLRNPGCGCHGKLFKRLVADYSKQVLTYALMGSIEPKKPCNCGKKT